MCRPAVVQTWTHGKESGDEPIDGPKRKEPRIALWIGLERFVVRDGRFCYRAQFNRCSTGDKRKDLVGEKERVGDDCGGACCSGFCFLLALRCCRRFQNRSCCRGENNCENRGDSKDEGGGSMGGGGSGFGPLSL
jgi:hypothetical protein